MVGWVTARPPVAPGTVGPRFRDGPRFTGWWLRGFWYGARHAPSSGARRLNWAVLVVLAATAVLYVAVVVWVAYFVWAYSSSPLGDQWLLVSAMVVVVRAVGVVAVWWPVLKVVRRARVFVSPGRDALLVVRPRRGAWVVEDHLWVVEDHLCARPGTGLGAGLRVLLVPGLLAKADELGVVVQARAASPGLAARYAAEVPGLVVTGPATGRGTPMRREPARQATG